MYKNGFGIVYSFELELHASGSIENHYFLLAIEIVILIILEKNVYFSDSQNLNIRLVNKIACRF